MSSRDKALRRLLALLLLPVVTLAHALSITVQSPHKIVSATVDARSGKLQYQVYWDGKPVGDAGYIELKADGKSFGDDSSLGEPAFSHIEESYRILGVKKLATNVANVVSMPLLKGRNRIAVVEARAYDDGFAWRLIVDGETHHHVSEEQSTWSLPSGKIWFGERNNDWKLKSYAGEFVSTDVDSLPRVSSQGPIQLAPLLIEIPNRGFELITEAGLDKYSGMRLKAIGDRRVQVNFTEGAGGFDVDGVLRTPWRVTLLAKDLNQLVNSDLITNLNPPPDAALYRDQSYIHPGRSVWRWWSRQTGTPEEEAQFVEYAAALGFEYSLVDDGWDAWPTPWKSMAALCAQAKARGVGVFVWKDYQYLADPTDNWRQLREFLDQARDTGVVGVKIDFLNAESKDRIDFEHAALVLAAQRRLMVDFHGVQKPTGERRTYPNLISSEAIRGIELNKMAEGPIPASHNAALPFTRFVVGPADYTPLSLTWPGDTTWSQQVASAILFTSPFLTIAEDPELLLKSKDVAPALKLIESIPSTWDETRVLPGSSVGTLAVMARRKGKVWYIAALNSRAIDISLNLEAFMTPHATIEELTSPEKRSFKKTELSEAQARHVHEHLDPGSGLVIRISPASSTP